MTDSNAARRLIEWTGERCVPWTDDLQVIYEHYHRYAFASEFADGKRVLDLASGEGYGAAMLARVAADVVGVDIDESSVEHARYTYSAVRNLRFERASITDSDSFREFGTFDLITCFEALEHVSEQEQLLQIVTEHLRPDGLFLVSTPDVDVYTHEHGNANPYHVKELSEATFRALMAETFEYVAVHRQNVAVGSMILEDQASSGSVLARSLHRSASESWEVHPQTPHTYLIAAASKSPLPQLPSAAILVDPELSLVENIKAATENELDASRVALAEAISDRNRLAKKLATREAEIQGLESEMKLLQAECAKQGTELDALRRRSGLDAAKLQWLAENGERDAAEAARLAEENVKLRAAESALAQRLVGKYRSAIERVAPRGSLLRDGYERALGRPTGAVMATADTLGPIAVKTSNHPVVTIVIPIHGKWPYTRRCLRAIEASRPAVPFEIVVVDDASPDDSAERVAACPGLRLVRTDQNVGFVGACNSGARAARGELLVFLNNDTEVQRGWLDELVGTLYRDDRIGLVGAKLVYPDGQVQECGGIVWADGKGWNYGRGGDVDDPRLNSVRDVDYCSGAAILVRGDLFNRVGGFDNRYAPAYYEDTDLAFAVRAAGYRTVVQPRSIVMHHEGISNGTEVTSGVKRWQEHNRITFAKKWQNELNSHLPAPTPTALWEARHRTRDGHHGGLVLVVDHQVPRPDHDSGSVRMRRILELLIEMDQRVVFFPANGAALEPYTTELQQAGVTVLCEAGPQAEFLREAGPRLRLALLSRPNVAWSVLEQLRVCAPDCAIVYDTVDLHFMRLDREADIMDTEGNGRQAQTLRRQAQASRELELALVRAADVTLTVSNEERQLLNELVPDVRTAVLSNVHEIVLAEARLEQRVGAMFVGSFDHPPNRDAARWLATEVWPLVRKCHPQATLNLIGSNPPPEVLAITGDGVTVQGWVEDLDALYRNVRLTVAPLRFGAGVKGKVGESLACGVPVVGTPTAFEGMRLRHDEHVLIGSTPGEIADHIVVLLDDDELWYRLSKSGQAAVAAQFGSKPARETLQQLLATINSNLSDR